VHLTLAALLCFGAAPLAADEEAIGRRVVLTPAAAAAGIAFRHEPGVTARRHLPETMGAGLAWLDYDGDGWLDLYLVQSGPFPPDGSPAAANRLFRNLGPSGRFEDVTRGAGAGDRGYGQGATAADVDGDGDADLYVTNYGPDVLLLNRGDGTFAPAAAGVGVDGWSSSAAFADAEGDGDLDLYVTGYVAYQADHGWDCGDEIGPDYCNVIFLPGEDDVFLRRRADGTFAEATLAAGFEHVGGRGLGVVWTDLDGDGRSDVYVANDLDPNRLFRNRGDGTFEDVSLASGAAVGREGKAEASMGIAVGDVDGDGRPDLAVTNFDVELNALYRNLGGMAFDDVSTASGFGPPSLNLLGFGVVLADLDGDGDLDAFVANGHVFERPSRAGVERAQRPLLLLGDGRGRFVEQRFDAPAGLGRGVAAADYDGDGDVDVAVQHNGGAPELWRNDTAVVRWLGVELRGRARNTQAVGARVCLVTGGQPTGGRRQTRWVMAGESYQSSGDRRPLFAWPSGEEVRELEVEWPSGRRTRVVRPPPGRYLRLVEP
jgi:hypothetical protein